MSTAKIPFARLCLLALLIFATAGAALAQSQATTGNIEGRVLDPKEAAVPGATVTATNQLTGLEKTATSTDEGTFTISFLPPGPYTVRANASGFSQAEVSGGYFSFVNINQYSAFSADVATNTLRLTRTSGASTFGLPRSINTPRQIQLAIKFDF